MFIMDIDSIRGIVIQHQVMSDGLGSVDDEVIVKILHLVLLIHSVGLTDTFHDYRFLIDRNCPLEGIEASNMYDLLHDIECHLFNYWEPQMKEVSLGRKFTGRISGRLAIFTTSERGV